MPKQDEQLAAMQRMVDLAVERTNLAVERTKMSAERSEMSADRSRMSAERSYLSAERTLSVWIRTALALMVFGIAIDRFGLLLLRVPQLRGGGLDTTVVSGWAGEALIAFGVLVVVVAAIRFLAYAATYRGTHEIPAHHGPYLAPTFAGLVALFGTGLFVLLLVA